MSDIYGSEMERILELSAEVERLTRERDEALRRHEEAVMPFVPDAKRMGTLNAIAHLGAEVERLRKALETEKKHACHCDFVTEDEPCDACKRITAALAGTGPEARGDLDPHDRAMLKVAADRAALAGRAPDVRGLLEAVDASVPRVRELVESLREGVEDMHWYSARNAMSEALALLDALAAKRKEWP